MQKSSNQYSGNEKDRKTLATRRMDCEGQTHKRMCRETVLVVLREGKFGLDNAIQTNAEFSYATAVMDSIGGWEEEEGEQENWCVQDSQRECGSFRRLLCATGKTTCKTLGSSN